MSNLPDAVPCPDKPALHLKGGYLCVAAPVDFVEACLSVPAVRALKHARPQGTLAVMCEQRQEALWQMLPQVDKVVSYPPQASARQLVKKLSDLDIVFESAIVWESIDAAKAMARAGVLQRFGYPAKGVEKFLTDLVTVPQQPGPIEHRVRHYLNFIEKLGVKGYSKENFLTPALKAAPEKLRIAIAPASALGESHQWPLENYLEVINDINKRYGEVEWVILGDSTSKRCRQTCNDLAEMIAGDVKNYATEWCERELLVALPHCSALLACDSETAHLAAHVGLPAAVIFGPNEPNWKRPLGKQSRVIREHVACSPCFESKCPLDLRCLDGISAEQVVAELEKALAVRYAG